MDRSFNEDILSHKVLLESGKLEERDFSRFLLNSLISVLKVTSYGIVSAFVDFRAKNLGAAVKGAFFALKIIFC